MRELFARPVPSLQNWAENFLGFGFALVWARRLERERPDLLHAPWATMPAAAALLLQRLTGQPFTMGAHAYDLYRHGGDWLLREKLSAARAVHTSTDAAAATLRQRLGSESAKVHRIRRSLDPFPAYAPLSLPPPGEPLRLLSVGRLTPKKGYDFQLQIYAELRRRGLAFRATIIGGGALQSSLQREIERLGLGAHVRLAGAQPGEATLAAFVQHHALLFTGRVARDGDRDGLPNVLAEAMASGCLVLTTPVAGTTEAIRDGKTGYVCPFGDPQTWADRLQSLTCTTTETLRQNARAWVQSEFDPARNAQRLLDMFNSAMD